MGRTLKIVVVCMAAAGVLGGCYRSPDVQVHKPGVYQGERDPLLAVEKTPQQQKRLQERFQLVQTDR